MSAPATFIATFTGSATWVAPAGVTTVDSLCVGGGGGSGGSFESQESTWGNGGGGGEYAEEPSNTCVAGDSYTISIGSGGTAGSSSGGNGGAGSSTTFSGTSATTVTAHGGAGGHGDGSSTLAAGGTGSSNTDHTTGGQGGKGTEFSTGGGGGGGGGGNASGSTGGSGPYGAGANGGSEAGAGVSPSSGYGGGAGGAGDAGAQPGAVGASGYASCTWTMNSPAVLAASTSGGTYTWTCPAGITSVEWTVTGSSGATSFDGNYSTGSESVTASDAYVITVGSGDTLTITWPVPPAGGGVLPYTGGQVYQSQRRKRSQLALTPPPPVITSGGFALGALAFTSTGNVVNPTPLLTYTGGQVTRQQRNKRRQQVLPSGLQGSTFGLAGLGFSGTVKVSPVATGGFKLAGLGFGGQAYEITSTGGFKLAGLKWAGNVAKETEPDHGGFGIGALAFSGTASTHFPFPNFILGLKYEVLINGTWTDISDFVYQRDPQVITRGLPDETQAATPSQMTVTLNNRDGRFSPKNPQGAYYPYLTRNVQLRVSVTNLVSSSTGVTYTGYRFWGEVSSWPPRWDPSQSDVYCQITVSGVLRRYVQGAKIGSTLRRYYTSLTGDFAPYGCWPAEDGSSATEISSALPGVASMTFTGTPGFASSSVFGGSDALPTISSSEWHGLTGAAADPPGTGSITETYPGTYYWTCPNGVTSVDVSEAVGAGGGGGDTDGTTGGGGGGGGEEAADGSVAVTAGTKYTYVVPAGGSAGTAGGGTAGGAATWAGDSVTVTAHGGQGGGYAGAGGAGGTGSSSSTHHNGGAGASGEESSTSYQSSNVTGFAGGTGTGADGDQSSTDWTAPAGITGDISVTANGAGGGGSGGGSGDGTAGGGGGGGGAASSWTTSASAGDSLTFSAGNGGGGGAPIGGAGGAGGDSTVSDGSGTAGGGGGAASGSSAGSGGSGSSAGGNGGSGAPSVGSDYGGGGGGGGQAGYGNGHPGESYIGGAGGGDGGPGGYGETPGSGYTPGVTGGYYGGGGGGGAPDGSGGGGGGGSIQWTWAVEGAPAGGGGGASGGTSSAGNAGSGSVGGDAVTDGGAGGNQGTAGSGPGGGGGGAYPAFGGADGMSAGNGAPGQITFSWDGGETSPVAGDIIRFCLDIDAAGSEDGAVLLRAVTYGTITTLDVIYNTASGGEITLTGYTGDTTYFTSSAITGINGIPLYVDVELNASGASAVYILAAIEPGADSTFGSVTGTVDTVSIGYVSDIYVDPDGAVTDSGTVLGQVTTQTYADTLVNLSPIVNGYAGELAADRISRLCSEQGIGFTLVGTDSDTPQMGPQQDDTLVNVLQSCADLDRGQLFETRDQLGIGYRTRVNMQGQNPAFLADYSLAELAGSLQPTADDQYTRNDITVTRSGGASATAALTTGAMSTADPPNGVGDYTYALTVQAYADSQLANLVTWMLTVGTVDEYRYPTITFDLTRSEVAGLFSDIPSLDVGDYVQIVNPPSFLTSAPVSQLCWGFTETLNAYVWTISINAVPESPYSEGSPPTW